MDYDFEFHPEHIDESVSIADHATVLGRVRIGAESSVWFGAVIRGDTEWILIGSRTNIQDLCVIHADQGIPCTIGDRVTVGHAAIVHGATVEDDVMIGMRAVVLNNCVIGRGSVIAAGSVVAEGTQIPPDSVVMGIPAKVKRQATDADYQRIKYAADHYVDAGREWRKTSAQGRSRDEGSSSS